MFELAQARVQAFMEARTFCLPEAFAIFAKVSLIPGNGASIDLNEFTQRAGEEDSGSQSTDGADVGLRVCHLGCGGRSECRQHDLRQRA